MKRILVASDLSPCSSNALARAIRLAAAHRAAIRIVHALTDADEPDRGTARRRLSAEAQAMADELTGRELRLSVRLSFAPPAKAILREAEAFDADLIVLGTHGEPRLRDALFGTTGTHVVRHAERPILVVQNGAEESYAQALVAIDDARLARPILDAALHVAPGCELFAVHAFYPSLRQTLAGQAALDREEERQEAELERLMADPTAGQPSAPALTAARHTVVETGDALSVIMAETEKIVPDLVVMGTGRHSTYLGSHAVDTLFWCPHDVLVVPEREDPASATTATA